MTQHVIYRGPGDVLEVGEKRLARDGEPVELTDAEFEQVQGYAGRRLEVLDEAPGPPAPKKSATAQVTRGGKRSREKKADAEPGSGSDDSAEAEE